MDMRAAQSDQWGNNRGTIRGHDELERMIRGNHEVEAVAGKL